MTDYGQITIQEYEKEIADLQGDCNNISLSSKEDEQDGYFTWRGCDIKHPGSHLGNIVYKVDGYNPKTKEIEELGTICGDCLQYITNAEPVPDFIKE